MNSISKYDNKGTAFTEEEREKLKIRARYPSRVETLDEQVKRCFAQVDELKTDMEKWLYLQSLQEHNEVLFYALILSNIKYFLPIIYTPTVGSGCSNYSVVWRGFPRGLYLNRTHKGQVKEIIKDWVADNQGYEPQIIVATDGTRILGLGDLGCGGHHITVGKLALYVCGGGFDPRHTLPVSFDFGCNTDKIRDNEFYLGIKEPRNKDNVYYEMIDEFISAIKELYPSCVFQFEDFSNDTAFKLLAEHRNKHELAVFNDDISGTATVTAACVVSAVRYAQLKGSIKRSYKDQCYCMLGAGAGGIGVAEGVANLAVVEDHLTIEQARKNFYIVDSKGLLCTARPDYKDGSMQDHKKLFAAARDDVTDEEFKHLGTKLIDVLRFMEAKNRGVTCLLGLSTIGKSFDKEVIEQLCASVEHKGEGYVPIVLALSNPTNKTEIVPQDCYDFSNGKALYASGSPFPAVTQTGIITSQCNNLYVFPAIGMGAYLSKASRITDSMMAAVSMKLATMTKIEDLEKGKLLPDLSDIRNISAHCTLGFIREAQKEGYSRNAELLKASDEEILKMIKDFQWEPKY